MRIGSIIVAIPTSKNFASMIQDQITYQPVCTFLSLYLLTMKAHILTALAIIHFNGANCHVRCFSTLSNDGRICPREKTNMYCQIKNGFQDYSYLQYLYHTSKSFTNESIFFAYCSCWLRNRDTVCLHLTVTSCLSLFSFFVFSFISD